MRRKDNHRIRPIAVQERRSKGGISPTPPGYRRRRRNMIEWKQDTSQESSYRFISFGHFFAFLPKGVRDTRLLIPHIHFSEYILYQSAWFEVL